MHLGFEAAGRLDDAQRHDIMQNGLNRTIPAILNRRERSGMTSGEWLDTPVKQHELVRRLQHDVAREHGFDMRDRVSRQNRTAPERVKITVTWIFYGILNMASTEEKITHAPVIGGASATYTTNGATEAVADSLAVARGNSSRISEEYFTTVWQNRSGMKSEKAIRN